jgi:hypothetical protein
MHLRASTGIRHLPVRALETWLEAAGIGSGAVFVSVTRGGRATATRLSDRTWRAL